MQDATVKLTDKALLPEWQRDEDPRREITLDQLLRMTSRLGFNEDYADKSSDAIQMLFVQGDEARFAASKPLASAPSTHWHPNLGNYLVDVPRSDGLMSNDDRPALENSEIEITPQMIEAGEAVLDRACDQAEVPTSWSLISAAKDVYIAMENARSRQAPSARTFWPCAAKVTITQMSDDLSGVCFQQRIRRYGEFGWFGLGLPCV